MHLLSNYHTLSALHPCCVLTDSTVYIMPNEMRAYGFFRWSLVYHNMAPLRDVAIESTYKCYRSARDPGPFDRILAGPRALLRTRRESHQRWQKGASRNRAKQLGARLAFHWMGVDSIPRSLSQPCCACIRFLPNQLTSASLILCSASLGTVTAFGSAVGAEVRNQ